MKTRVAAVLLILTILTLSGAAGALTSPTFSVDAEVGVLLDADSGQILFSQNGTDDWIPASLVKVMTLYVAFDQVAAGKAELADTSTVSEKAWRMGGSQMFLEIGEQVTLQELLYGISVVSGNDATVAVAEALAGTEDLYVRWMNDKADSLGLDLHFDDVSGLSRENRITGEDMAWLAYHYINEHPQALHYHQKRSYGYQPRSRTTPIVQNNRNGLLERYEGTDGLKTGYLRSAGYNLVATAKQNGRRLIAVVLGADNERHRENVAVNLLNYGFRSFEVVEIASLLPNEPKKVYKGEQTVSLAAETRRVSIPRGTRESLQAELEMDILEAPLKQGDTVGHLILRHDGEPLRNVPLTAAHDVERGGLFRMAVDSAALLVRRLFHVFQ